MKFCLLLCLMVWLAPLLIGVNHMDLITTITGDFGGASLGWGLASLDFNGDGIKDLAVLEKAWNPSGIYDFNHFIGRIYFYWGGTDFDNVADFTISGTYNREYGASPGLVNAGDLNNDGREDLMFYSNRRFGLEHILYVFLGSQNPTGTPDYVYCFNHDEYESLQFVNAVGDINHDGYDDVAISAYNAYTSGQDLWMTLMVLSGIDMQISVYQSYGYAYYATQSGLGDVNGDGYDDYQLMRGVVDDNQQFELTVFYGNGSFPPADSVVICPNTVTVVDGQASPLGDVNGDGYDDFLSSHNNVWFGGTDINQQYDLTMPVFHFCEVFNPAGIHGDLNNDGYEDIIGSDNDFGSETGRAWVWMGSSQFNAEPDFTLIAPQGVMDRFGYAKAAGDFNNDGCCDLAISQPWSQPFPTLTPGRVHVYAGNTELDDPVPVEDETIHLLDKTSGR